MRELDHEIRLPTLLFFQNGNGWKGSSGLLRFYIRPREEGELPVEVWCGPFCRELSQVDDTARFPLSAEGVAQMKGWLEDWSRRMAEHPTRTPEETLAYRNEKLAEGVRG